MTDKERLKLIAKAPDEVKERIWEHELADVKADLGPDEVARIESRGEEEADARLRPRTQHHRQTRGGQRGSKQWARSPACVSV